nr:DUF488 domain-containing protein [Candidatus Sigynarchaeota archaeon]
MMIYTIGFAGKSAEKFFGLLQENNVKKIIDIRLKNSSQLSGFAKSKDLQYFLKKICNIEYEYEPELTPTAEILDEYKKKKGEWSIYEKKFIDLMIKRKVEALSQARFNNACLLCSEDKPMHCHRRLVAEYLSSKWNAIIIKHLV